MEKIDRRDERRPHTEEQNKLKMSTNEFRLPLNKRYKLHTKLLIQ